MGEEPRTILTCSKCKKTSVYNPDDAHCFDCTMICLAGKLGYSQKEARLRRWRSMAYHTLILVLGSWAIAHYYDFGIQLLATLAFITGQIIDPLTRWLASKF